MLRDVSSPDEESTGCRSRANADSDGRLYVERCEFRLLVAGAFPNCGSSNSTSGPELTRRVARVILQHYYSVSTSLLLRTADPLQPCFSESDPSTNSWLLFWDSLFTTVFLVGIRPANAPIIPKHQIERLLQDPLV